MKIGILTFHRAHNCGAMLQCVALQTVLERMGHDVCVIDCNKIGEEHRFRAFQVWPLRRCLRRVAEFAFSIPWYDLRIRRFVAFRKRFIKSVSIKAGELPASIDRFIVGSDQVFQPNLTKTDMHYFLLEGVENQAKKITYAASFGYDSLPPEFRLRYQNALSQFSCLAVREDSGRRIIGEELSLDKNVSVVLDPTLLLDADDYKRFETPCKTPSEYVLIYSIGGADKKLRETAAQIASARRLPIVMINACRRHYVDVPFSDSLSISPDRFLYLVRRATYVVTTSFHGVAFSLIFKRPFVAIVPEISKVVGRIVSLLSAVNLEKNILAEKACIADEEIMSLLKIEYEKVSAMLNVKRQRSLEVLSRAINAD